MNSITNISRYLPHDLKTKLNVVNLFNSGIPVRLLIRRYHVSKASIYRWVKAFDGSKQSLVPKSHRPLSPHPNPHNNIEINWIKSFIRRNPTFGPLEIYSRIVANKNYTRCYHSFLKHFHLLKGYHSEFKKKAKQKYKPLPYDTPSSLGENLQIDVKFVPNSCKDSSLPLDKRFFQYTSIDEASRERFIHYYYELSQYNSSDFLLRAIAYFGYVPKCIQTDNGCEFTRTTFNSSSIAPFTALCNTLNINHKLIRPGTPRHNGKVERSHRNDNNRFFKFLSFSSLQDLNSKGAKYLKHSNNVLSFALGLLSPLQMRAKLSSSF